MKQFYFALLSSIFLFQGCAPIHPPLPAENIRPNGEFQSPLRGSVTILSRYGPRGHRFHTGLDLRVHRGTHDPVYASRAGRVVFVGQLSGYGRIISLQHEDGFYTRYAHLQKELVKTGEHVRVGQIIGAVGRTGHATTEHLHFEILTPKSRFLDPYPYIFGPRRSN